MDRGQGPPSRLFPLYALLGSACLQVVAAALSFAASRSLLPMLAKLASRTSLADLHLIVFVALQGLIAWALASWLKLPTPWRVLNLIIVPFGLLTSAAMIPAWMYAVAAAVMVAIYLPTFWTHVPFYPTARTTYDVVAELLPADRPFTFIDLGCGFGTMLQFLSGRLPLGRFDGVEIGVAPYLIARMRAAVRFRGRGEIRYQSIWNVDLGTYDVVYAFLAPGPMERLWEKVEAEMKPGSLFISNAFPAPAKADRVIATGGERNLNLYVYER